MPNQRLKLVIAAVICTALIIGYYALPKLPAKARAKAEQPTNPDSLKLMQAVELVQGENPMEGITILRDLVAKDSNNVDAHLYLGMFSVKSNQIDKAIKRFDKVLALRPNDAKYQVEVGFQYLQLDSVVRAYNCFERGVMADSTDNNSLFFLGQTSERLQMPARAKQCYEQLLRHTNDSLVVSNVQQYITEINKKLNTSDNALR
jgi:predicted Zn-dependent protease